MRHTFATFLVVLTAVLLYFPDRVAHQAHAAAGSPYTLLQMNLCLSGRARCFQGTQYPLGVEEAVARIIDSHADAVTLNEVCSGDVEEIARVTSYSVRFAAVMYRGALLPCRDPGDRGVFGIAVLTRDIIMSSTGSPFQVQDGVEERRWICATTGDRMTVCATHLNIRGSAAATTANDAQCAEFANVLANYDERGALIGAGDMNRDESCAPAGMWTRNDAGATQAAGMQQVYGDARFGTSSARVVPMAYTDHDGLVVTSWLAR